MEGSVMTQHPSLEHRVLKAWGEMGEMKSPIEDKFQQERIILRGVFQELHFLFSLPSYSTLSPSQSVVRAR